MTGPGPREWYEMVAVVPAESAEAAAAILLGAGCHGLSEVGSEPVTLTGAIPVEVIGDDALAAVTAALDDLPHSGLLGPISLDVRRVREEDWASAWRKHFKPLEIGARLVVRPPWESYTADPGRVVVELDPGMAFGTGTHPTTRLCLEALDAWVRDGDVVADIGTGSGILAIAAARLGASTVHATDIDALPRSVARDNVARNGLSDRVLVHEMDSFDVAARDCTVVVANILASTIVELLPSIAPRLRPGGIFIGSGIVEERLPSVLDALASLGFEVVAVTADEVWRAVVGRAPQG